MGDLHTVTNVDRPRDWDVTFNPIQRKNSPVCYQRMGYMSKACSLIGTWSSAHSFIVEPVLVTQSSAFACPGKTTSSLRVVWGKHIHSLEVTRQSVLFRKGRGKKGKKKEDAYLNVG